MVVSLETSKRRQIILITMLTRARKAVRSAGGQGAGTEEVPAPCAQTIR